MTAVARIARSSSRSRPPRFIPHLGALVAFFAGLTAALLATSGWAAEPTPAEPAADPPPVATTYTLDPTTTTVRFTLDTTLHLVRGTAALTRGSLTLYGDGRMEGEVVIDARSLESGNKGRDEDMHEKVLESARFPTITLLPSQLVGRLPAVGPPLRLELVGELDIHGARHAVRFPLTVRRDGERFAIDGTFTVPYVAWGMKDPSKLILSAAKEVAIELSTVATPQAVATAPR